MTDYSRTVRTQAELDSALADGVSVIDVESSGGVWLYLSSSGSATVRASGSATVRAYGSATVHASDSATVRAYGSATVHASGSATVHAYDSATVTAYDSATVTAYDSATVTAYDSATVTAYDSATVHASGSATVHAYDSATVHASDSATVTAYGSATVTAYDSATVHAYDSATVTAGKYVAVHLHNKRVKVTGGVVIDVTDIDKSDSREWCGIQGVDAAEDGTAVVYKAVNAELVSGFGMPYPVGETVTAPDWQQTDACGRGLHFGPTPGHAHAYYDSPGSPRFLACRIRLDEAIGITGGGTPKIKARSCEVLYEVDLAGRRISGEETQR